MRRRPTAGSTLLEVIVAVSLLCALAGLGLSMSVQSYQHYEQRTERDELLNLLVKARSYALTNRDQEPWGVCSDTTHTAYILFSGTNHTQHLSTEDISHDPRTTVSGLPACDQGALIFAQLSGTTTPTTIILTSGSSSSTIVINYDGGIDW